MPKTNWLCFISILSTFLLSSCGTFPTQTYHYQAAAPASTTPGFTNVLGWDHESISWNVAGQMGSAVFANVQGYIGYPLTISSPTAYCNNAYGQPATWNITASIVSGTLPAGLVMDSATSAISGTPTEAGVFTVEVTTGNNMYCNGQSYMGFDQMLLIHIGTTPPGNGQPTDYLFGPGY